MSSCGRESRGSAPGPGAARSQGCSWCTFRILKSHVLFKSNSQKGGHSFYFPCHPVAEGWALRSSPFTVLPSNTSLTWQGCERPSKVYLQKRLNTVQIEGRVSTSIDSCLSCASLFLAQELLMWKLTSSKESFSCKHLFLQKQ